MRISDYLKLQIMKKGNGGNSKGSHYWRNKIKNERKPLPTKFKGRIRSKGYKPNYPKSAPTAKGQKWQNKIRAERGLKTLKSTTMGRTSSIAAKKRLNKLKKQPSQIKSKPAVNVNLSRKPNSTKKEIKNSNSLPR